MAVGLVILKINFCCSFILDHHVVEKRFQCPLCPKKFNQKEERKEHLKCQHPGLKPFVCPVCGKGFAKKSLVKEHVQSRHPRPDEVSCAFVGGFERNF